MRGVVYIERENTVGDRAIVGQVDLEGLPSGTDQMAAVRAAVQNALGAPDAYRVRAVHDQGWASEIIYSQRV